MSPLPFVRHYGSMPIIPDSKNWTWVLERPCAECGFDAATITEHEVAGIVRANAAAWPAVLERADVAVRPDGSTWSGLEYAAHVRDVFRLYRSRLLLMLAKDDPMYPNWDQDETAVVERYNEQDPATVATEIVEAGSALADAFDAVPADSWHRPGRRSDGARFTVASFAVYLAHDLKHERDVAIKVLHPDLGATLGGERFLSEIRTTARLQHPHILPLLDSGDADGLLYYVMPLVTGETLRARLERERQLPIADAVRIAREVASALDYAHRQNVIHRDIKPENILLHDGSALVADFGIALAVQSAGGARMTQTGLSLGTPQYMSPEQAMGERTIDARSDIYALGAVTYEMLAGDAPFTGSSVQAIVAKVLTEKPTSLHTLRDTVPPYIEHAVFTALAKLPADRFESAKAFADALNNTAFHNSDNAAAKLQSTGSSAGNARWKLVALALG